MKWANLEFLLEGLTEKCLTVSLGLSSIINNHVQFPGQVPPTMQIF
jgi:hypothetical protein